MLWIVILFPVCSSEPLSMHNNARFQPSDIHFVLDSKTLVQSQTECAWWCFTTPMCLTATFVGVDQRCTLIFARLEQGSLHIMVTNIITSVLSFKNKTLPCTSINMLPYTFCQFF